MRYRRRRDERGRSAFVGASRSGTGRARTVAAAVVVAVAAMTVAAALKSWCGVPGAPPDLYLRWCYSDIPPLWFTERLHVGAVPYLDHPVEYPVVTGAVMWLAALPTATVAGFFWLTVAMLAACAAATAWLLAAEVGWPRVLAFAAAPTLALSGAVNWDLAAVALATAGLVAHRRGRDGWSGVALGLGTAAKLFPVLFLPPVVLAAWRLRGRRAALGTAAAAVAAWAAVNLPVAVVAPGAWLEFVRLNRTRPSDWDALTTIAMMLTGWDPATAALNVATGAAFAAGAAVVIAVAVRRDPPATWHLVSLPLLAWFLLANKVYSPQFSLWLLPLLALAFPGWRWWLAFAATDVAVTLTRFPYLANFTDGGLAGAWPWWPFAAALLVRAVVLALMAAVGWRRGVAAGRAGAARDDRPAVAAASADRLALRQEPERLE